MTQDYSRFFVQVEPEANNGMASIPTESATNSGSHGNCSATTKTTITNFPVAPQILSTQEKSIYNMDRRTDWELLL